MAAPLPQQRLLIQTPTARLEALAFTAPERAGGAAAVILHPYAPLGGTMSDPMVQELFRAAAASPAFSFVLRYNQRGVGRSCGRWNLRGRDDMADVLDVVEFAAAQLPGPDKRVVVIGYSWGSCLAAYGLAHPAVAAYVGVSFPLGGLSWVLQTSRHFAEVARATHLPRLLLLGDQDQFTKLAAMRKVVLDNGGCLLRQDDSFEPEPDAASAAAAGGTSGSLNGGGSGSTERVGAAPPGAARRELLLRVFPGADHFWMEGSLGAAYAVGWLEALLLRQREQQGQQEHQEEEHQQVQESSGPGHWQGATGAEAAVAADTQHAAAEEQPQRAQQASAAEAGTQQAKAEEQSQGPQHPLPAVQAAEAAAPAAVPPLSTQAPREVVAPEPQLPITSRVT